MSTKGGFSDHREGVSGSGKGNNAVVVKKAKHYFTTVTSAINLLLSEPITSVHVPYYYSYTFVSVNILYSCC